jgi:hypothetical protein
LFRDVLQLRRKGDRIPGELRRFVGHSSLLLLSGLTGAVWVAFKKINILLDAVGER